jgi:hypothetical protein
LTSTVSTTEATTENTIMSRHPGQPPNGRFCTRPGLMSTERGIGHAVLPFSPAAARHLAKSVAGVRCCLPVSPGVNDPELVTVGVRRASEHASPAGRQRLARIRERTSGTLWSGERGGPAVRQPPHVWDEDLVPPTSRRTSPTSGG